MTRQESNRANAFTHRKAQRQGLSQFGSLLGLSLVALVALPALQNLGSAMEKNVGGHRLAAYTSNGDTPQLTQRSEAMMASTAVKVVGKAHSVQDAFKALARNAERVPLGEFDSPRHVAWKLERPVANGVVKLSYDTRRISAGDIHVAFTPEGADRAQGFFVPIRSGFIDSLADNITSYPLMTRVDIADDTMTLTKTYANNNQRVDAFDFNLRKQQTTLTRKIFELDPTASAGTQRLVSTETLNGLGHGHISHTGALSPNQLWREGNTLRLRPSSLADYEVVVEGPNIERLAQLLREQEGDRVHELSWNYNLHLPDDTRDPRIYYWHESLGTEPSHFLGFPTVTIKRAEPGPSPIGISREDHYARLAEGLMSDVPYGLRGTNMEALRALDYPWIR